MAPTPPALSGTVWVTIPDPRIIGRHGVDEVGALVELDHLVQGEHRPLRGAAAATEGWDPKASTSSWLVLTLLLSPPVLWSRHIRGSGETAGIQGND